MHGQQNIKYCTALGYVVSNDSLVVNIWQDVKRRGRGPILRLIKYLVEVDEKNQPTFQLG